MTCSPLHRITVLSAILLITAVTLAVDVSSPGRPLSARELGGIWGANPMTKKVSLDPSAWTSCDDWEITNGGVPSSYSPERACSANPGNACFKCNNYFEMEELQQGGSTPGWTTTSYDCGKLFLGVCTQHPITGDWFCQGMSTSNDCYDLSQVVSQ